MKTQETQYCRHGVSGFCAACSITAQETQFTLLDLSKKLGCHVQPYPGGGAQVFIGRAEIVNPVLYREFWNLSDAHVVGTLSGPSLHIVGNSRK